MVPASGPLLGGTAVYVVGYELSPLRFFCSFGLGHATPGTFLSPGRVDCTIPPMCAQSVVVTLAAAELFGSLVYTYLPQLHVYNLSPPHGPLLGGTIIALSVDNIVKGYAYACRFIASSMFLMVSAQQIAPNLIECATPSSQHPKHAVVEVAVDSQEFGGSSLMHEFVFHPAISIHEVYPSYGPVAGGTETVMKGTFHPTRSASLKYVMCRFNRTYGVAVHLSASHVSCVTPHHSHGVVNVEVRYPSQRALCSPC